MPSLAERLSALLNRIRLLAGGRTAAPADPRWPHLRRGWLDPDVLLQGHKTTVALGDLGDALRAIASASGGRLGEAEVAEILDVVQHTPVDGERALRFGRIGVNVFSQIWTGLVRTQDAVRIFLLGDQLFVDAASAALSVSGFPGAEKRAEYELLRRFFVAAWEWRWTEGPDRLRTAAPSRLDPLELARRMEHLLSEPSTPFLEALRGLRRRVQETLDRTRSLEPAEVERADAFLAARGAPTLTEMRRRLGEASGR